MTRTLLRDNNGAGAAEFGLVLPLLILLLLGVIDGGRFLWELNRAEKATQAGVRAAVVTDIIPGRQPTPTQPADGFVGYSFVGRTVSTPTGSVTLTQGDRIPSEALTKMICTNVSCTCETGGTCPPAGTYNSASFTRILTRVQQLYPTATATNVVVEYTGSGLGFAGDPNGMDISPVVSVRLTGHQFRPIFLFGMVAITLPDIRSSLTAEDSVGSQFN